MRATNAAPNLLLLALLLLVGLAACSEKRTTVEVGAHPEGWLTEHGKMVLEGAEGPANCASCHGDDFKGGDARVSCKNAACHPSYPHPEDFLAVESVDFHGEYLATQAAWNAAPCKTCHGQDYKGGKVGVGCKDSGCHAAYPHADAFTEPTSPEFHGTYLATEENWDPTSCQSCHGTDYAGGRVGVGCKDSGCHAAYPHPDDFTNPQSGDFHGAFIASVAEWDLSGCQTCHGTAYDGEGEAKKTCLTCHSQPEGPEACNTCHGSGANAAPPEGLMGESNTSAAAVGAHQSHFGEGTFAVLADDCAHCHVTPSSYSDPGHVGDGTAGAEVVFSAFASHNGTLSPVYDATASTCDNVYCHGAFQFRKADSSNPFAYTDSVIVGNNPTVNWTDVGTGQVACGSCHGLPPQGHLATNACASCHGRVVDVNNNIIDRMLHINGQVEVF